MDLPQEGAFQQQVVIDLLKNHPKKLYRAFMSALDHQDKLDYLTAKIKKRKEKPTNVHFKNSKMRNRCISLYAVFFG